MKKIIVWVLLSFLFICNTFAFDSDLSVNKSDININTPIQLKLKINNNQKKSVAIKKIKWIKDFNVIWQSQSQSSISKVVVISWKTQVKDISTFTLLLALSAKKSWSYTIWPAILQVGNKEYKTNSINVKITGAKIMLNNTKNYLPQQNNTIQQSQNLAWSTNSLQQVSPQILQQTKIKNFEQEVNKVKETPQHIYLIIALLSLAWLWFIIYLSERKEGKKEYNGPSEDDNNNEIMNKNTIDFEEKPLDYPNINDNEFIIKIDKTFRKKIEKQFDIPDVETKTYDEILSSILENEKVKEIIDNLKLLKYSNLIADREKLLMLVKEL